MLAGQQLHYNAYVSNILIFFFIKYIFGICGLKTLFFGILVSIRITDGTWVLEKDEFGTSVYFSFQYLKLIKLKKKKDGQREKRKKKFVRVLALTKTLTTFFQTNN
jgi:hypothetical protein